MRYSVEVFPPKGPQGEQSLTAFLGSDFASGAEFASVTCGAGGDGSRETDAAARKVIAAGGRAVIHLTCAGGKAEVLGRARSGLRSGASGVLCLSGDAPQDPHGFADAVALTAAVRAVSEADLFCAGYPEPHPRSRGPEADLDWLARKFDAGARTVLTQYCFDADAVLRFRDRVRARLPGMTVRPGVLPVRDLGGLLRFSAQCGARVPETLVETLAGHAPGTQAFAEASADLTAAFLDVLGDNGIGSVHVYALNSADAGTRLRDRGVLTLSGTGAMLAA